ncbi:hypothetical protein [Ekhidna sp.]
MKYKFSLLLGLSLAAAMVQGQSFEGRLSYENYSVIDSDTIESSSMSYWIKDHLYKHKGVYKKNPLVDLGTLYANAADMTRSNLLNAKVERIKMSPNPILPDLLLESTKESGSVSGYNCKVYRLTDGKGKLLSKLWITDEISNDSFDEFVELFEYNNTLFPITGIKGWILKREDYRREGKIFVSEAKEVKSFELQLAEMLFY